VNASRAANERAATLVKAQEAVCRSGDADARASTEREGFGGIDGRGAAGARDGAKPERTGGAQIRGVEGAVDAQGGGKATWTAREVERAGGFTVQFHLRDTLKGLEGAD
jgi:hypothetical protein